jgi:hypothetical protein
VSSFSYFWKIVELVFELKGIIKLFISKDTEYLRIIKGKFTFLNDLGVKVPHLCIYLTAAHVVLGYD